MEWERTRGSGVHQATEYTNQGTNVRAILQCDNNTAGTKVWNIPASWPREDRLRWQAMQEVCGIHGLTSPPSSDMERFPVDGDNLRLVSGGLDGLNVQRVGRGDI